MEHENEMAMEALKWIVHDILERKSEAEKERADDFSEGRSLAYFEVADMVQSRLDILGIQIDGMQQEGQDE